MTRPRLLLMLLCLASPCLADVLVLDTGTIEGNIISETPEAVQIRTRAGVVTVQRARIRTIERKATSQEEYQKALKSLKDDDVVGHFALGTWCREKRLNKEAEERFRYVLKLNPDHEAARKELGYEHLNGRWLTHDEAMQAKGFVKHNGRWVTPQAAEKLRKGDKQKELTDRINLLVHAIDLGGEASRKRALSELATIKDPDAIDPLSSVAEADNEAVRKGVIDALTSIGTIEAADVLARLALTDPQPDLRSLAVAGIKKAQPDAAANYFTQAIRAYRFKIPQTKDELDFKRRVLSRASAALGQIGDKRAVPTLISVLVVDMGVSVTTVKPANVRGPSTTSVQEIGPDGRPTGRTLTGRTIESSVGGTTNQTEPVTFVNEEALNALRKITGKDFGMDPKKWGDWWVINKPIFKDDDAPEEE